MPSDHKVSLACLLHLLYFRILCFLSPDLFASRNVRVYLLLRVSGTKTLQDRVEHDIFGSRIFDTLKAQFSSTEEFHDKIAKMIVPVQGDITIDLLGLSDKDLAMIREDVHVIINSAASVSFDDPLNNALEVPRRSTC